MAVTAAAATMSTPSEHSLFVTMYSFDTSFGGDYTHAAPWLTTLNAEIAEFGTMFDPGRPAEQACSSGEMKHKNEPASFPWVRLCASSRLSAASRRPRRTSLRPQRLG